MPLLTHNDFPPTVAPPKSLLPLPLSRFRRLVTEIRETLGPNHGITASDAVRMTLQDLLEEYESDESAWKHFAFRDSTQTFTRNLVDRGNGSFNLLLLVWSPGAESVIHDHADSHCIMKILKGSLQETRYAWPSTTEPRPMQVSQTTNFHRDQVTYMADTLGLHKISNPDPHDYAVSLHLYTPPNAAIEGCNVFDAETGKATHVKVYEYYSEHGRRCGS